MLKTYIVKVKGSKGKGMKVYAMCSEDALHVASCTRASFNGKELECFEV